MLKKTLSLTVIACFFFTSLNPFQTAHANSNLSLPAPGSMVNLTPAYQPAMIKGLTVHKDNPFLFDFIVDVGQDKISGEPLKKEGEKLIKYFLASLAIPDKDVWVNLSPYEKSRIIPDALGQTDMGRDLLAQDYILKQITASLIYPEKQLGKKFWDTVYAKARMMYGTAEIPVNTFNKVWIVADRAKVFEHNQTAFVVDQHLKVMLDEDYLALSRHSEGRQNNQRQTRSVILSGEKDLKVSYDSSATPQNDKNALASNIVRSIILPEIEKEVNTGKNFANLRQIFNSIILSSWYKKNLKAALLNQVYANKSKIKGLERRDVIQRSDVILSKAKDRKVSYDSSAAPQNDVEVIYQQYLTAYKKGVFNFIKEDLNAAGTSIPRKYFSGGVEEGVAANPAMTGDVALLAKSLPDRNLIDISAGVVTGTAFDAAMLTPEERSSLAELNPSWTIALINQKIISIEGQIRNVKGQLAQGVSASLARQLLSRGINLEESLARLEKDLIMLITAKQFLGDLDVLQNKPQLSREDVWKIIKEVFSLNPHLDKREADAVAAYRSSSRTFNLVSLLTVLKTKLNLPAYFIDNEDGIKNLVTFITLIAKDEDSLKKFLEILKEYLNSANPSEENIGFLILSMADLLKWSGTNDVGLATYMAKWTLHLDTGEVISSKVDAAMAVLTPGQIAELKRMREQYPLQITMQAAAEIWLRKISHRDVEIQYILNRSGLDIKAQKQALIEFYEELAKSTDHIDIITQMIDKLKSRGDEEFTDKEKKAFTQVLKDTADAFGKLIIQRNASKLGIIFVTRVSEGIGFGGRDNVPVAFQAAEVYVPENLTNEMADIKAAIDRGEEFYLSKDGHAHLISDVNIDVVEGTNETVGASEVLGASREKSGGTSTMTSGLGVRSLGNAPDGYVGQLFTNLGRHAQEFRDATIEVLEVNENGQTVSKTYHLSDVELYSKHPERIRDYFEFLAKIQGIRLSELKEELVIMKRPRETAFRAEILKLQQEIPGLSLIEIKDGTVPHGLKAVMPKEVYEAVFGVPYGDKHVTMLTIGGTAEGYMNLGAGKIFESLGAVGSLRHYSAFVGDTATGQKDGMQNHSRRYKFKSIEKEKFLKIGLDPQTVEAILKGEKVFDFNDINGEITGMFSFITNNQVFQQAAPYRAADGKVVTRGLSMSNVDGKIKIELIEGHGNPERIIRGDIDALEYHVVGSYYADAAMGSKEIDALHQAFVVKAAALKLRRDYLTPREVEETINFYMSNYKWFTRTLTIESQLIFLNLLRSVISKEQIVLLRNTPRKSQFLKRLLESVSDAAMASKKKAGKDVGDNTGVNDWHRIYLSQWQALKESGRFIGTNDWTRARKFYESNYTWFTGLGADEQQSVLVLLASVINPKQVKSLQSESPKSDFLKRLLEAVQDKAQIAVNGGIDLNTANGMQWKISKDGNGVEIDIDRAMIERIQKEGIGWLSPVILKMTPVNNVWTLLGLHA